MTSELFKPSRMPLMVRGTIADNTDFNPLRRSDSALSFTNNNRSQSSLNNRPATQGGYRFGQLSHNAFFARHNPHPTRVKHMKGLLDIPICTVSDDGYFANPRYSREFPPNGHDQNKLKMYSKYLNIPANAINVNTQRYPINTITGLQYFLGKPLNMRVFREKAVPRVGLVPVTEAWQDELRALTEAVGLGKQQEKAQEEPPRPRTTQYSTETGRLIPPPSRAMSRGNSRQTARDRFFNQFQNIIDEDGVENMVMQMLCQILQTEDIPAVQAWLVSAGDREKSLVLDMIKSSLVANEEYYKQYNDSDPERSSGGSSSGLPAITEQKPFVNGEIIGDNEINKQIDRLSLEAPTPRPPTGPKPMSPTEEAVRPSSQRNIRSSHSLPVEDVMDLTQRPVTSDAFRPRSNASSRPKTNGSGSRPKTPRRSPNNNGNNSNPEPCRLRYTKTPVMGNTMNSIKPKSTFDEVLNDDSHPVWNPDATTIGP